jgi:hypothetical protein
MVSSGTGRKPLKRFDPRRQPSHPVETLGIAHIFLGVFSSFLTCNLLI